MRIFCGNIDFDVNDQELEDLFSQYGEVVSAHIIHDRITKLPRGFGFVEMTYPDEARRAIEALDGSEHEGRKLTVNEARPRTNEGRRD